MKNYIQHALDDHPDSILQNSIKNCHLKGMHSIMFDESWRKIRMFYTSEDHELHHNFPENYKQAWLSVGFHPHHCNISLAPIVWKIQNWSIKENPKWNIELDMYRFQSHIHSGKGWFKLLEKNVKLQTTQVLDIHSWDSLFMPAQEMHTVSVKQWEKVAWFVFEWEENPQHNERCYSNKNLTDWSTKWLYTPFESIDEIKENLYSLWVI